jgi:hypothetical protein
MLIYINMSRRNRPIITDETNKTEEPNNVEINKHVSTLVEIPNSSLHGRNLKKIKAFNKVRKTYKLDNQQQIFVNDVSLLLSHMDISENEFDLELLLEICNIANEFFIYGSKESREESKKEALDKLLLPYFRDDVKILDKNLKFIKGMMVKNNFLKRNFRKLKNIFF